MPPTGVILLARMDSARFPGKALADALGTPLLSRVLERVRAAGGLGPIILATTARPCDDPLAEWAAGEGVGLHRSRLATDDVAGRFLDAASGFGLAWAFRVNGDSPFVDPALLRAAVGLASPEVDLVTNLAPRRWPYGVAVELVRVRALAGLLEGLPVDDPGREHVTRPLYRGLPEGRIAHLPGGDPGWADVRAAVDTRDDLHRFVRYLQDHGDEWPISDVGRLVEWSEARSDT